MKFWVKSVNNLLVYIENIGCLKFNAMKGRHQFQKHKNSKQIIISNKIICNEFNSMIRKTQGCIKVYTRRFLPSIHDKCK